MHALQNLGLFISLKWIATYCPAASHFDYWFFYVLSVIN
jgi:hypothetical protein